jgi:hypothetical protein
MPPPTALPRADELHGDARVMFDLRGLRHAGRIHMDGTSGYALVSPLGTNYVIREDVALHPMDSGALALVGSNPRQARTGVPDPNWAPEVFEVARSATGSWRFTRVCDVTSQCSEAIWAR